jgi:hypothetical protein
MNERMNVTKLGMVILKTLYGCIKAQMLGRPMPRRSLNFREREKESKQIKGTGVR